MKFKSTFEFDAFGPWILLINEGHKIPPLFAAQEGKLKDSLMTFKIPRDIERRDANPNMNLYDAVLGISRSDILLFKRINNGQEDRVEETRIPMNQISGLRNNTYLLSGVLTIYTAEKTIEIPYNTVSDEIIQQALNLIRQLTSKNRVENSPLKEIPALPFNQKTMELEFINICKSLQNEDPNLRLISYQPSIEYKILKQFNSTLLMYLGIKETVQSSYVIFLGPEEISIVQRTFFPKGPNTDSYAHLQCFLPLSSLGISSTEKEGGPLPQVKFSSELMDEEFYFDPENPGIRRILKEYSA